VGQQIAVTFRKLIGDKRFIGPDLRQHLSASAAEAAALRGASQGDPQGD
jgi:hypothetical protein